MPIILAIKKISKTYRPSDIIGKPEPEKIDIKKLIQDCANKANYIVTDITDKLAIMNYRQEFVINLYIEKSGFEAYIKQYQNNINNKIKHADKTEFNFSKNRDLLMTFLTFAKKKFGA